MMGMSYESVQRPNFVYRKTEVRGVASFTSKLFHGHHLHAKHWAGYCRMWGWLRSIQGDRQEQVFNWGMDQQLWGPEDEVIISILPGNFWVGCIINILRNVKNKQTNTLNVQALLFKLSFALFSPFIPNFHRLQLFSTGAFLYTHKHVFFKKKKHTWSMPSFKLNCILFMFKDIHCSVLCNSKRI